MRIRSLHFLSEESVDSFANKACILSIAKISPLIKVTYITPSCNVTLLAHISVKESVAFTVQAIVSDSKSNVKRVPS